MDILEIVIASLALFIACLSLWVSVWTWKQSNRPIVVAYIATKSKGNIAIAYDLVVENVGTRPAEQVRLIDACQALDGVLLSSCDPAILEAIRCCFDVEYCIPVLAHGRSARNSFGATSSDATQAAWKVGTRIPIRIEYKDLEGRSFASRMTLVIQDSEVFAGGSWG